jgi:hypothetical protein
MVGLRFVKMPTLHNAFFVGKDEKLNDDAMQDVVESLRDLLLLDLLKSLMSLKDHAFWDLVAEVSLSLCKSNSKSIGKFG